MEYDFIVVGSGLAGLNFALKASKIGKVLVISKSELIQANTWRAQGGVAAVVAKSDSFEQHIQDTLVAGDGLCQIKAVTQIVEQGPDRIKELESFGVHFDHTGNNIDLGQEGGHSQRRILHVDDSTGQALHSQLISEARKNKNITLKEHTHVIQLLMSENNECIGIKAFDQKSILDIFAPYVILATGGAGKVFLYTSNWSGATGDGIAMAYKAGARLSNMEFTQFHPTCLYHPMARNFLISEALRGEGAHLLNKKGQRFMINKHPLKELAPRDIVARAIDEEMKTSGTDCVLLDLSYLKDEKLKERFPKIYKKCLDLGIDFLKEPIPVVPAAHYLCGGIQVDLNSETSLKNLYAIGECADTGLHGANRLASNSLLECLATSHLAMTHIANHFSDANTTFKKLGLISKATNPIGQDSKIDTESRIHITSLWEEIRRMMWYNMGIVRSDRLIRSAKNKIFQIKKEIEEIMSTDEKVVFDQDFIELQNISIVAEKMIDSAADRKESRGCHFNKNKPKKLEHPLKSISRLGHHVEYIPIDGL